MFRDSKKQKREILKQVGYDDLRGWLVVQVGGLFSIETVASIIHYKNPNLIGMFRERKDAEAFCAKHKYNLETGKVEAK